MGTVAPRYFDLWAVVADDAKKVVAKDRKGFAITVPLKARQKPSIAVGKAFDVVKSGFKKQHQAGLIPKDARFEFLVYEPDHKEFDAMWFRSQVMPLLEKFKELSESTLPEIIIEHSTDGSERVCEIKVSWREVVWEMRNGCLF